MKSLVGLILLCAPAFAEDLPLLGLARVGVRVSDLEKARAFYGGVLGLEEAFHVTKDGGISAAYFKVNDHQFIEISPRLDSGQVVPMTHIAMYTDDIERLHKMIAARGVAPTEIEKSTRDGNLSFSIRSLPGQSLEYLGFLQYQPDSLSVRLAGKFLGKRRLSTHLEHAGIVTTGVDAAYKFYVNTLGFTETWHRANTETHQIMLFHLRMPGASKDYVELSNLSGNPALTRARAGMAAHCSLEVPDIQAAYREAMARTGMRDLKPPRFGLDERWQFNLFDPDGTRVELMQPRDPAKAGTAVPPVNRLDKRYGEGNTALGKCCESVDAGSIGSRPIRCGGNPGPASRTRAGHRARGGRDRRRRRHAGPALRHGDPGRRLPRPDRRQALLECSLHLPGGNRERALVASRGDFRSRFPHPAPSPGAGDYLSAPAPVSA